VIRYTINGDEPDEYSAIYSEPLRISSNAIIKAGVFRDGYKPSSCKIGLKKMPLRADWPIMLIPARN